MDRYTYDCKYCGAKYTPKRRFKQKYCSNSCRVNAFNKRKQTEQSLPDKEKTQKDSAKKGMSWSGIGDAAVGTLATNLATSLFTKEENKPATKGDIQKLLNGGINNLILVKNIPVRMDGTRTYFDTIKQILIYK
ncbi:hypothetical protein [Bizionia sp.]|uniref:hypothetical protein n=1 Tax=Bizionia sp. TaxID=1954480 RepID=UPI003A930361